MWVCHYPKGGIGEVGDPTSPERVSSPSSKERVRRNDKVVIFDEYGPVRMIRTEEWKYVHRYADGPHDLFHLTEDPDERTNLAEDQAHNKTKGELKAEMEAWFARYVTPEHDGLKETY